MLPFCLDKCYCYVCTQRERVEPFPNLIFLVHLMKLLLAPLKRGHTTLKVSFFLLTIKAVHIFYEINNKYIVLSPCFY